MYSSPMQSYPIFLFLPAPSSAVEPGWSNGRKNKLAPVSSASSARSVPQSRDFRPPVAAQLPTLLLQDILPLTRMRRTTIEHNQPPPSSPLTCTLQPGLQPHPSLSPLLSLTLQAQYGRALYTGAEPRPHTLNNGRRLPCPPNCHIRVHFSFCTLFLLCV
ncbi:hypothetical protein AB205_0184850 [Aquarana catesbeiana]|uniref:Uncharacterized protein n=1 Tax=Aquarana catesbeiana TaxID=8400 RepID=A0A2G9RKK2_AQUCT|nr:hypothetical protein AB205_0184850 [Aquarana catesbeiana]